MASFIRDSNNGAIYYLANGLKYWITDVAELTYLGVTSSMWQESTDSAAITAIPSGPNITDNQQLPAIVASVSSSSNFLTGTLFGYPTWMVIGGGLLALFLLKKEL